MDLPPEVSGLLGLLTNRLAARGDLVGLYVYGSLTAGDFSSACSDIDVLVLLRQDPDAAATRQLTELHLALLASGGSPGPEAYGRSGGVAGQLHCLYAGADTADDAERLRTYWFGDRMTQWQVKVLTRAELVTAGTALYGPWPPPVTPVPVTQIQAAVRAEIDGYWRRMARKHTIWRQDEWVDHGLVVLPRAEAVLTSGELITKSEAIRRLPDFGVPAALATEIRQRRDGLPVAGTTASRLDRARVVRRIMNAGVSRLSQL
jgi:hypothetical protein